MVLKRLGRSLAVSAAKEVMKGIVETWCTKWSFEEVLQMAQEGQGVHLLFPQQYLGALREQGRRFPEIRDSFELKEFLSWVKMGNEDLYNQVAESGEVMRWLSRGWEEARRNLFTTPK